MSMAVCAMSGVWLFDRNVPLFSKKFSRFGIISRSEGTFGLSRKKCTLSNVSWTTCLMPLPSWQPLLAITCTAGWAAGALVAASPGVAGPAKAKLPRSDAHPPMAMALPEIHRLPLCCGMNSSLFLARPAPGGRPCR